ncbi:hypothetical protein UT300012_24240 [Paraclostridium bifermentans]
MLIDKILKYASILKIKGSVTTPVDVVEGLLDAWEILRLKQAMLQRAYNIRPSVMPQNKDQALEMIRACENEGELVYYTLAYMEFRNPILQGVTGKFLV